MEKFVYSFSEGSSELSEVLGYKGSVLAEMTNMGLPLPFGFTVTKKVCSSYYENDCTITDDIRLEIIENIKNLETVLGKQFGNMNNPLLLSVRSGAVISIPGMIDSVSGIGLNDETVEGLAGMTGNETFAKKSYDTFKSYVNDNIGKAFTQDPYEQILMVIENFFDLWNSESAKSFRKKEGVTDSEVIAVNIQAMVFGNLNDNSCSGVAFSRNPSTGKNELYGKYLVNAQAEELTAGTRTSSLISDMVDEFPEVYRSIADIASLLEEKFKEMLLIEFIVENGRIYIIQIRHAKRTAEAALKIAVDMVEEGLIEKADAVMRVNSYQVRQLQKTSYDYAYLEKISLWARAFKKLKIRTNVSSLEGALKSIEFGADGIGLCRTEHMFFNEKSIPAVRKVILSEDSEMKENALTELKTYQKNDFKTIFEVMEDRPVTIRLFDASLHNFMPVSEDEIKSLARQYGMAYNTLKEKIESIREDDPMLGLRGCRVAVFYPELIRMQTKAIIESAAEVKMENRYDVMPEIMIPIVSIEREFEYVKDIVSEAADECIKTAGVDVDYKIGTMIETPRACMIADKIVKEAYFCSFGTNDLTQLCFGFSRDAMNGVVKEYQNEHLIEEDPFQTIDYDSVGALISIAVKKGRIEKSNIKFSMCGDHVGEPSTVDFCCDLDIDYVSCSPQLLPAVQISAAQNILRKKAGDPEDFTVKK